ncbi:MAG: glycosyltransferase [Deltaproteobacteria bacterium]|nr:MAG: glycosyltransferase [Deltaproteobacteria bacterium]
MENGPLVSIILPAHNERENLKLLIPDIAKILSKYNHEIIIIDDASIDGTKHAVSDFNVVYIYNHNRQGLAKSIKLGIDTSLGEHIIVMDSDGDHNSVHLPLMINNLKISDVVLTSRFKKGSKVPGKVRPFLSLGFNLFVRVMTGGKLSDYLYGHWAANKKALEKINSTKVFWGYGDYCIRLLFYFEKLGMNIHQIPSISGERKFGRGNSKPLKVFFQYTVAVFKLSLKERFKRVRKGDKLSGLPKSNS